MPAAVELSTDNRSSTLDVARRLIPSHSMGDVGGSVVLLPSASDICWSTTDGQKDKTKLFLRAARIVVPTVATS